MSKMTIKVKVFPGHTMEAHAGVVVYLNSCLTLALGGREWSIASPRNPLRGGLVDPKARHFPLSEFESQFASS